MRPQRTQQLWILVRFLLHLLIQNWKGAPDPNFSVQSPGSETRTVWMDVNTEDGCSFPFVVGVIHPGGFRHFHDGRLFRCIFLVFSGWRISDFLGGNSPSVNRLKLFLFPLDYVFVR